MIISCLFLGANRLGCFFFLSEDLRALTLCILFSVLHYLWLFKETNKLGIIILEECSKIISSRRL